MALTSYHSNNSQHTLPITTPVVSARSPPTPFAVADTGCTGHFITTDLPYTNKQLANPRISVIVPNGGVLRSTHTATLNLPGLPASACAAHIFPHLASGSLISIGQLCDHGCTAHFNATTASIQLNGTTLLHGQRSSATGKLWHLDLPSTSPKPPPTRLPPPAPVTSLATPSSSVEFLANNTI
jgi:hypothetical protein